jgi:tRNA A64-2'-O-ribosylphosphate transferase
MPFETISSKQSIYKLCRELKKEEHSLFNCLSSIVDDAAFCSEIRVLYPDLPLLANLRCGLWYAPRPDGTCYFKSTDGHQHNQTFSTTRLNWHVAEIAARKGGCIVVDATRKGKRAPVRCRKAAAVGTNR